MLTTAGDEFDEADFGVSRGEHPDEVTLDTTISSGHFGRRGSLPRDGQSTAVRRTGGQTPQQIKSSTAYVQITPVAQGAVPRILSNVQPTNMAQPPQTAGMQDDRAQTYRVEQAPPAPQQGIPPLHQRQALPLQAHRNAPTAAYGGVLSAPQSPKNRQSPTHAPDATPPTDSSGTTIHEPPIGFFAARAAESLQNAATLPPNAPVFNPHLESPSIRKTAGIDHTKTKPVIRDAIGAPPTVSNLAGPPRINVAKPSVEQARRIGMPGVAASPLQNRNSYKLPQMKRPAEPNVNQ